MGTILQTNKGGLEPSQPTVDEKNRAHTITT